ncbi:MAG: hypothetical protein KGL39_47085 [Patescibacteria group bacterium]|nr:hypothetical protein [Patescibacteria group bacterium]
MPDLKECDECGMQHGFCLCGYYWKDGALHGMLERLGLSEDERVQKMLAASGGNWGNPLRGAERRQDGTWLFRVARGGMAQKSDFTKVFPNCTVEWVDYMGSLKMLVRQEESDGELHVTTYRPETP